MAWSRLGVPGSLTFTGRKESLLGRKATREIELEEVVAESYRIYQTLPEGAFKHARIDTTVSLLRAA